MFVLLVLLGGCGDPPRPPPAGDEGVRVATAQRAALTVRVMSVNLRWDGFDDGRNAWAHRRAAAVAALRRFAPDSVGCQEPMVRQIDDLLAALPELECFRFDNDPVYVRTQQILFHKRRFERIDGGGFLLADGTNEGGTVRYCTWVRLRERTSGRAYYHYNVHLDHRSAASRRQSVRRLMRHIDERGSPEPFVVTGDFNTPEDSPEMRFLRGEQTLQDEQGTSVRNPIALVDTFRVLHADASEVGTAGGFRGRMRGRKIDHVLVAAGAAHVHEAAIDCVALAGRLPSDHFPVTAVIEWPGGGGTQSSSGRSR